MCVSPIRIPNPNYHKDCISHLKDTQSFYINVPCGVCTECLMSRQMQFVQRARTMALDHYIFFCTLTYNNESIPKITTSTGVTIKYADISDVQNMIKRIRRYNQFGTEFKYFFVTERGGQFGRPHIHGLFFIPKHFSDDKLYPAQLETSLRKVVFREWRRNYGSSLNPVYKPLFSYRSKYVGSKMYSNFDLHYVTPYTTENGSDDVAFYATKYLLKPSNKELRLQQALKMNLSEDEFTDVWKLVKSKSLCSKFFGACTQMQISKVKHFVDISAEDSTGFKYYIANGNPQPLAKYYRRFISAENGLKSLKAIGSPIFDDNRSQSQKDNSLAKGRIILQKVQQKDNSELF